MVDHSQPRASSRNFRSANKSPNDVRIVHFPKPHPTPARVAVLLEAKLFVTALEPIHRRAYSHLTEQHRPSNIGRVAHLLWRWGSR